MLDKNLEILRQHPDTAFLTEKRLMVAYRRPRNLKDSLVRSDLVKKKSQNGSGPCGKNKCQTCKMMKKTDTFSSTITQKEYKIHGNFDCQSQCVIYLITCELCKKQYVGQTGTTLNNRMTGHRHDIKHQLDKPVSNHFSYKKGDSGHSLGNYFKVTVIDKAPSHVTSRILREVTYIRQLVTMDPHGMNVVTI
jgi:hypothetical protein